MCVEKRWNIWIMVWKAWSEVRFFWDRWRSCSFLEAWFVGSRAQTDDVDIRARCLSDIQELLLDFLVAVLSYRFVLQV
jgi:hypothetical protein